MRIKRSCRKAILRAYLHTDVRGSQKRRQIAGVPKDLASVKQFGYFHVQMRVLLLAILLASAAFLGAQGNTSVPRFTDDNQLIRPEGYREWVYLSSGLGMSYDQHPYDKNPRFTNVFVRPEAYREFVATGKFPDGTVLVLEIRRAESKGSINKGGQFQDQLIGIEASVKDDKRFPEKWAYFSFIGDQSKALPKAKAFPKEACWKCHNEHGAVDNVFVQFYPALREARDSTRPSK